MLGIDSFNANTIQGGLVVPTNSMSSLAVGVGICMSIGGRAYKLNPPSTNSELMDRDAKSLSTSFAAAIPAR